jgi:hypothetical protein
MKKNGPMALHHQPAQQLGPVVDADMAESLCRAFSTHAQSIKLAGHTAAQPFGLGFFGVVASGIDQNGYAPFPRKR